MKLSRLVASFFRWATGLQATPKVSGASERTLLIQESRIGSQLFGPLPKGHKREFFCLDASTWIWHESWVDAQTGRRHTCTTRYEVHPHAVLKQQDGGALKEVVGQELYNFAQATDLYMRQVGNEVYGVAELAA